MISRWLLVPLDLVFGGRLGIMFAARDGFYAVRDGQRARQEQRRLENAHHAITAALDDACTRRVLEDDLLRKYGER